MVRGGLNGGVVNPANGAFHRGSLAPHSAHLRADIHGLARSTISFTHRLRRRPRAALELVQHRIRNEACPLRVDVAVAGATLTVREEALGNHCLLYTSRCV